MASRGSLLSPLLSLGQTQETTERCSARGDKVRLQLNYAKFAKILPSYSTDGAK